ncbi:MAG: fluoride efflux transporter CrcB [Acidimicrobiales bacterium]
MASENHPTGERLPIDPDVAPSPGSTRTGGERTSVLFAIALGAVLGAPARYGIAQLIHVPAGSFPWATFVTNVTGSFVLGLFMALILERFPPTRYLRPFVATGFLGAYTTYSTFAVETDLLVKQGHVAVALAYAAASLLAGFIAVWAGIWMARTVPVPHRGGKP